MECPNCQKPVTDEMYFCVHCGAELQQEYPSVSASNMITENRAVSGFNSVSLAGIGQVNITQGAAEDLLIQAEDNIMPLIKAQVFNGTLMLGLQQSNADEQVRPTEPIKFDVKVRKLDAIELSGAGIMESPGLTTEDLSIKVSGAAAMKLERVTANHLSIRVSGSGAVKLRRVTVKDVNIVQSGSSSLELVGYITSQAAILSGAGRYEARNLNSKTVHIVVSGSSRATVWVQATLEASISGSGRVSYYGSPTKVSTSITGSGSIKNLGNK